jgi:hypothetical protein
LEENAEVNSFIPKVKEKYLVSVSLLLRAAPFVYVTPFDAAQSCLTVILNVPMKDLSQRAFVSIAEFRNQKRGSDFRSKPAAPREILQCVSETGLVS